MAKHMKLALESISTLVSHQKFSIYGSLNKGFKKLQIIREIQIPGRACIKVAIIKYLLQKVLENILFQYTLFFISILANFKYKNTSI